MKIHVENYGVISNATIDLSKPLTVFCGGNGTGKTYMSYMMYAICNTISTPRRWGHSYISRAKPRFVKIKPATANSPEEWYYIIDPIALKRIYAETAEITKNRIDEIFGLSDEDAEIMFKTLRVSIPFEESEIKEYLDKLQFDFTLRYRDVEYKCHKGEGLKVLISIVSPSEQSVQGISGIMPDVLQNAILKNCVTTSIGEPCFLPVERNSIYTFNKELSISRNNLIDEILQLPKKKSFDPFTYVEKGSKRYPLAIRDAINIANDLSTIKKQKGEYYDWALKLEEKLLRGQVDVTSDGDVIFLPKGSRAKRAALPIHMTASVVKTLSSFVFYLKYQAKPNHLIIIDEPEMNFHPDSQIVLVSIVAELMNAGLRFFFFFYSDYIIREFNKLILADAVRNKYHKTINDEVTISKEKVGAYYFAYPKRAKKVVVQELEVGDKGFSVPSIDAVVEEQNRQIEDLIDQFYFVNDNR